MSLVASGRSTAAIGRRTFGIPGVTGPSTCGGSELSVGWSCGCCRRRQSCHRAAHVRYLQDFGTGGPLLRTLGKQASQQRASLRTVHRWHRARLCRADPDRECREALRAKRAFQCKKFVKYHSKAPDISFEVVRVVLTQLRRHTVRSANLRRCTELCSRQHFRDAKVPKLRDTTTGQEDVLTLHITMHYTLLMDVSQGKRKLSEDGHCLPLVVLAARLTSARDCSSQVASICILHDNAKVRVHHEGVIVAYDVRMRQSFQHLCLTKCLACTLTLFIFLWT
mmetsp:Transcript_148638/g.270521  ORF Transcript_148638/g.270521 Transcript_148638/m.270521 type:complete len:280 (+) Transcript_148638:624-1463(+)